jgi:hypothetical protein
LTIGLQQRAAADAVMAVTDQAARASAGIGSRIDLVKPIVERRVHLLTERAGNPVLLQRLQPRVGRVRRNSIRNRGKMTRVKKTAEVKRRRRVSSPQAQIAQIRRKGGIKSGDRVVK